MRERVKEARTAALSSNAGPAASPRGAGRPWAPGPRPRFSASSLRAEPGVGGWAQEGAMWLLHLFPRSPADPTVLTKDLFKVFPVVSAVNGPLTKSMNQVSRVKLQETLLRACPTLPATQSTEKR